MGTTLKVRRLTGHALVGGATFPISQFTASYARNNIPSCSVVIPLGQNTRGAQSTLKDTLKSSSGPRVTLKVVVSGETVFNGHVTGNTFIRAFGTAGVQITGASFLGDMHATSALSSRFSAMIPGDLFTSVSQRGGAASQHAISSVNTWNSEKLPDLWALMQASTAELVKPSEATATLLAAQEGSTAGAGSTVIAGNTLGVAAFSRVQGDLVLNPFTEQLRTAIAGTVNEIILADEGGQTLFSKLLTCAMTFGFSFIPRVNDGLAVAAFPFSRDVGVVLPASEYEKIEGSMQRPFPTSAVALMGTGTLAAVSAESSPKVPKRVGFYDSGIEGGVLHLQSANKWLNDLSPYTKGTRETSGVQTPRYVGRHRKSGQSSNPREEKDATMGDAYAKWIWNNIAYANRSAPVVAAYRTDICPGSSVKLECPDFKGRIPLFGFVEAVTLSVDALNATANTTLLLSSIRTEQEMASAQSGHPLFQNTFYGDTLVTV